MGGGAWILGGGGCVILGLSAVVPCPLQSLAHSLITASTSPFHHKTILITKPKQSKNRKSDTLPLPTTYHHEVTNSIKLIVKLC